MPEGTQPDVNRATPDITTVEDGTETGRTCRSQMPG